VEPVPGTRGRIQSAQSSAISLWAALGARKRGESEPDLNLASDIKREVLDVLWLLAWLRDRSRRARCFLSWGPKFFSLKPIDAVEAKYDSHHEWLYDT
jgi:hypothetical protein